MGRSHGRTRNGRVSVEKHRKVSLVQESAFTEWSLHFTEDAQITTLQSILDNILHILTIWAFEAACFKIHVRESFIVAWLIYDQLRSAKLVQPSGSPACKTRQSVHSAHNPMALINFIILVFNLFCIFDWLSVCFNYQSASSQVDATMKTKSAINKQTPCNSHICFYMSECSNASSSTPLGVREWVAGWAEFRTSIASRLASLFTA